jgi:hypothetical protein
LANHIRDLDIYERDLDFQGAFTMVAVTNGVSDILHRDHDDGGLTWVVPIGDWEGGELCLPQLTKPDEETPLKVQVRPGDAIAFQANLLCHFATPILNGYRLALTCFTDANMLKDCQK